ncbi:MAG TPA: DUF2304 domain-containing protein [Bacillota bacterium]|nr:DUF2304 domain-containing protein [Bacillota bacterium]
MGSVLRVFILVLGVVFAIGVVFLLVRRRINERNSLPWLAGALAVLVFSAAPELLDFLARVAGVDYPPALLFLLSTLIILFILLHQSIQISVLQDKCRELAQLLAVISAPDENGMQPGKGDRGHL